MITVAQGSEALGYYVFICGGDCFYSVHRAVIKQNTKGE